MKICIATDAWHPQVNGVVTTLSQTVATLTSWGHQILLLTPEMFSTFPCPTYPEINLSLVTRRKICAKLATFEPDAVHIATEGPIGWATRAACKKSKLAFTTSYHTKFPEYVRMRAPVPLAVTYPLVRAFHRRATRTMVAPTLINELREKHFNDLVPWTRGVDTDLFKPGCKDFLEKEKPVFLYVGRVAVEKNLPAFLDLILPGEKYVVGDGPALNELQQKYPEVHFTGVKKDRELARHIAASDVFVFPSLTDTFGVVLLEAMACGVPVAAFPVTGPNYIVKNGKNGYVDKDLKLAVLKALEVSSESCRSSASAYSWENCTRQFYSNLDFQEVVSS